MSETADGGVSVNPDMIINYDPETVRPVVNDELATQTKELLSDLESNFSSLRAEIDAQGDEIVTLVKSSDSKATVDTDATYVVQLNDEQWDAVRQRVDNLEQNLVLQNAMMLFTLMLCAGLIGMRVFSEFVRGFRR